MNWGWGVFAIALAAICLLVGIFIYPSFKEIIDGVITAEGSGWYSEVQAAVGMLFIILIGFIVIAAISVFFRGNK